MTDFLARPLTPHFSFTAIVIGPTIDIIDHKTGQTDGTRAARPKSWSEKPDP
jgi:hypothetical protein